MTKPQWKSKFPFSLLDGTTIIVATVILDRYIFVTCNSKEFLTDPDSRILFKHRCPAAPIGISFLPFLTSVLCISTAWDKVFVRGEVMSGIIFQSFIYIYTLVRSQVRFQGKRRSHEAGRF